MNFGRFPPAECEGAILAHSVRLQSGYLSKGRTLTGDDIEALLNAGIAEIMVAFLGPGDIDENDAAHRIAALVVDGGLRASEAKRGRVNLYAKTAGLMAIDPEALLTLNRLDEGISVAALPDGAPVEAGQLVGTVKIVPFALDGEIITAAESLANGEPLGSIEPFRPAKAGLILTTLDGTRKSLLEKARASVEQRLVKLGSRLLECETVPHHETDIAGAIARQARAGCAPILVLGATATLDRQDVVPEGMRRAGGEVTRFGMPVDPGNLLLLGRLGEVALVGLPGCARSLNRNGFDWVLERILAGREPTSEDISALGAGGLLKEIPGRPQPREGKRRGASEGAGNVWAVVLAAGRSTRMGRENKLLSPVEGKPMAVRTVAALKKCALGGITVVLGHQAEKLRQVLPAKKLRFVENKQFREGMASSIRCGITALNDNVDAALIVLADMPRVQPQTIASLIAALKPEEGRTIALPRYRGKRGNPVLFARQHFEELAALEGDQGAKELLVAHAEAIIEVAVDDPGVLVDVDTKEMLRDMEGD